MVNQRELLHKIVAVCEQRVQLQQHRCARLDTLVAEWALDAEATDEAYLELLDAEERLLRARLELARSAED